MTAPASLEIERRFLVTEAPADLAPTATLAIEQGYVSIDPVVRLRRVGDDTFFLTMKRGLGAVREERETPLTAAQFATFWPLTAGRRLQKIRRRIPWGEFVIEFDTFAAPHEGLLIAEVEFPDAETMGRFTPPAWFGREVTDDPAYTNARLAVS